MKKFWFQLFGLVLLTSIAMFLAFNQSYLAPFASMFKKTPVLSGQTAQKTNKLVILGTDGTEKASLNIELANTKDVRAKGLGYRDSLATTSGMLFIHETPQKYTYWMKGMRFPIDIMWISGDTIADIIPNIPPPIEGQTDETLERYQSTVEVDKVLETNAGFVMQNNILEGDKIVVTTR